MDHASHAHGMRQRLAQVFLWLLGGRQTRDQYRQSASGSAMARSTGSMTWIPRTSALGRPARPQPRTPRKDAALWPITLARPLLPCTSAGRRSLRGSRDAWPPCSRISPRRCARWRMDGAAGDREPDVSGVRAGAARPGGCREALDGAAWEPDPLRIIAISRGVAARSALMGRR